MESFKHLLKVLWLPAETMFLVSKKPNPIAPLLFLCVCSLASSTVFFLKIDPGELAIRMAERSSRAAEMTPQAKERIAAFARNSVFTAITFTLSSIGPLISVTVVSVVFFGVFTLLGREGAFKAFFGVTAFAFVPAVLWNIAALINVLTLPSSVIMPDELASVSASVFVDRASVSPVAFTAANMVDIGTLWILVLLVIGYRFVARKSVSTPLRTAAVFGVWLIYAGARLGLASLRGF